MTINGYSCVKKLY